MPISYAEDPVSIGDHIRKKRLELKLRQIDVAGRNYRLKGCQTTGLQKPYSTLSEALTYYNIQVGKKARQTKLPQHAGSFFKPSAAVMAFLAPETKLSNAQKKLISKLCQSSTELKRNMALVKKFRRLIVTFHIVSYLTRHKNKAIVSVS